MATPRVYVETSVLGYLTSRPSRDLVKAARQQITADLWAVKGTVYEPFVSGLVLQEAAMGDPDAARLRLLACRGIAVLPVSDRVQEVGLMLIAQGAVPASEPEDALHLALATVAQVDYVVSWNFAHIVGPAAKLRLQRHIERLGLNPPLIATPEELLEELT
jgi:predicted nucleic acid-binding protein